ncbi:MAG: hypothetical protein IT287_08150 [Bdellovibrionaceae bacterium]|nr:hypothetical protein [Pseudobdellovibrionaceae bacterium]
MKKMKTALIFLCISLGCVYSLPLCAAVEVDFLEVIPLVPPLSSRPTVDISIYVDSQGSWALADIRERLTKMNEALSTCQVQVQNVFVYQMRLSEKLVRVDDDDESAVYYDGFREIARKSQKVTAVQIFYVEKYLNPFSSTGSLPYAIDADRKDVPSYLHNTVWIPYFNPSRVYGKKETYSMEAHELGHIFMRKGHDDSGESTIMADSSSLRQNLFSQKQCSDFKIKDQKNGDDSCEMKKTVLSPLQAVHYKKYGEHYYMTLYCARNSKNLYEHYQQLGILFSTPFYNIFAIHKDDNKNISPLTARDNAKSWSNHSFLIQDGLVIDLDYSREPQQVGLNKYLKKMWGTEENNLLFQVRPASEITEFTNLSIRASFASGKYPIYTAGQLKDLFSKSKCAQE